MLAQRNPFLLWWCSSKFLFFVLRPVLMAAKPFPSLGMIITFSAQAPFFHAMSALRRLPVDGLSFPQSGVGVQRFPFYQQPSPGEVGPSFKTLLLVIPAKTFPLFPPRSRWNFCIHARFRPFFSRTRVASLSPPSGVTPFLLVRHLSLFPFFREMTTITFPPPFSQLLALCKF